MRSVLSAIRIEVELRGPKLESGSPDAAGSDEGNINAVVTATSRADTAAAKRRKAAAISYVRAIERRRLQRRALFFASPAMFGPQLGLSLDFGEEDAAAAKEKTMQARGRKAQRGARGGGENSEEDNPSESEKANQQYSEGVSAEAESEKAKQQYSEGVSAEAESEKAKQQYSEGVSAEVYHPAADGSRKGCGGFISAERAAMKGKVVVVQRGGCSFVAKARNAQQAGCVGLLVVDLEEQDEYNPAPMSNMLPRTAGGVKAGVPTKPAGGDARGAKQQRSLRGSHGWSSVGSRDSDTDPENFLPGGAASAAFLLTMADDGTGDDVYIPAGLIGKAAGVDLLRMAQVPASMIE
jgi:hypothetical protein